MIDKPIAYAVSYGRQAGGEAAYFLAGGFAFFFTKSARSLGGMASIRRAISSRDICGSVFSFAARTLFMVMEASCGRK
jgi:hypothetical protein